MKSVNVSILILLLFFPLKAMSSDAVLFWYDEAKKIHLWQHGYSDEYQSSIYSESPNPNATKQVLTGKIIVVFVDPINENELQNFMAEHGLTLVEKLEVGISTYVFEVMGEHDNSLQIANTLFKESNVKASYPDWMYLIRGND